MCCKALLPHCPPSFPPRSACHTCVAHFSRVQCVSVTLRTVLCVKPCSVMCVYPCACALQDAPAPAVCPVTVPDSDVTPVQYTRVLSAYDATWLPLWSQEGTATR